MEDNSSWQMPSILDIVLTILKYFSYIALMLAAYVTLSAYGFAHSISGFAIICFVIARISLKIHYENTNTLSPKRIRVIKMVLLFGILVIPVFGEVGYLFYDNNVPRLRERERPLERTFTYVAAEMAGARTASASLHPCFFYLPGSRANYSPFTPNTSVAVLDEPSSLTLSDNFPRLDGATALFPIYAAFVKASFAEAAYIQSDIRAQCSKTPNAYDNLIKRNVDMIFVAQPSKEQTAKAQQENVTLKFTPIGKEAFVFIVNAQNRIDNLSSEQVRDIYSGNITVAPQNCPVETIYKHCHVYIVVHRIIIEHTLCYAIIAAYAPKFRR